LGIKLYAGAAPNLGYLLAADGTRVETPRWSRHSSSVGKVRTRNPTLKLKLAPAIRAAAWSETKKTASPWLSLYCLHHSAPAFTASGSNPLINLRSMIQDGVLVDTNANLNCGKRSAAILCVICPMNLVQTTSGAKTSDSISPPGGIELGSCFLAEDRAMR